MGTVTYLSILGATGNSTSLDLKMCTLQITTSPTGSASVCTKIGNYASGNNRRTTIELASSFTFQ
tara:strand:+ start:349 stop:543 length:195 start_codon:yes stop_codon:yes gene_type:complete